MEFSRRVASRFEATTNDESGMLKGNQSSLKEIAIFSKKDLMMRYLVFVNVEVRESIKFIGKSPSALQIVIAIRRNSLA